MKILHICFFVLVSVKLLFSQDIEQAEVKVIEGFIPEIPESEKIRETTEFIDTTEIDTDKETYSSKCDGCNPRCCDEFTVAGPLTEPSLIDITN